jgi:hypothetical protein
MLAPSPPRPDNRRRFHGLWSLWDMQELKARPFVNAMRALAIIEQTLEKGKPEQMQKKPSGSSTAPVAKSLLEFIDACTALGADVSLMAAVELYEKIASSAVTFAVLHEEVRHLHKYFERHLESAKLFALNPDDARYYDTALEQFGDCVTASFPSTASEIDEAGKCLALGRAAAAIFHLMRVVEIGLRSIAPLMGIHEPKPDWGKVIRAVDDYLKLPKDEKKLDLDDSYLAAVSAQMHAVKLAWRNQVMHVDTTFSLENAREIFEQTKLLMIALSIELHEPS